MYTKMVNEILRYEIIFISVRVVGTDMSLTGRHTYFGCSKFEAGIDDGHSKSYNGRSSFQTR